MYKRILIPLDGSPLAERALAPALAVARQDGAEVILMRVPVPASKFIPAEGGFGLFYPEPSQEEACAAAQCYLDGLRGSEAGSPYRLRTVVAEGDVAGAIVDAAAEHQVDLIVMSSHGYSGLTRWLLGSVAEKVLHGAPCPVLVMRSRQEPRHMLIPLDGSALSEQALRPALDVAQVMDTRVTLLRVVPEVGEPELNELEQLERGLGHRLAQEVRDEAAAYLQGLSEANTRPRLPVEIAVRSGPAAQAILKYAELHDVDLIAMATHGRTGLQRWIYGSVTEKVVRMTPASLLVVRPPRHQLN